MAHGTRINGTTYGITGGKCLVGGTEYSIKKGRALVGGTGYDITFGTPLSSYGEGDTVFINENGSPVEFYIAKHDYESVLNGAGRTLLLRNECVDKRKWDDSSVNAYASSTIDSWLNNTYKNMLGINIQGMILSTKISYTPGNRNNAIATIERDIFLLSAYELGQKGSNFNQEGSTLPNATNYQIAKLNGNNVEQWTRSPDISSSRYSIFLSTSGADKYSSTTSTLGCRPAFTLPSSVIVGDNKTIV